MYSEDILEFNMRVLYQNELQSTQFVSYFTTISFASRSSYDFLKSHINYPKN